MVYKERPLGGKKSSLFLIYFLIKLTSFKEILTLIKINGCLRHSEDIGLTYCPFLRFFLILS